MVAPVPIAQSEAGSLPRPAIAIGQIPVRGGVMGGVCGSTVSFPQELHEKQHLGQEERRHERPASLSVWRYSYPRVSELRFDCICNGIILRFNARLTLHHSFQEQKDVGRYPQLFEVVRGNLA